MLRVFVVCATPHLAKQLTMGKELVCMDHKSLKQTVLSRRKLYLFLAEPHRSTGKVDRQVAGHKHWPAVLVTNTAGSCTKPPQPITLFAGACEGRVRCRGSFRTSF